MTNSQHTYNGWTNYESWAVALWLDNDEGSYNHVREIAAGVSSDYELAEALKDLVQESAPDLGASMFADLLNAAISEVDWLEIAQHITSEV